jgi:putative flippase GtrA
MASRPACNFVWVDGQRAFDKAILAMIQRLQTLCAQHAFRVFKYALVGATTTLIDIAALWLLLKLGWATWLAVAVAFAFGTLFNFLLHRKVTFNDSHGISATLMTKYVAVVVLNLMLTEGVVLGFVYVLQWPALWGKLAALPLILIVGYTLSRVWVFRKSPAAAPQ